VTDHKTLDQMTSDELDQLYNRLAAEEADNAALRRWLLRCSHREAIDRVRDLADRWDRDAPPPGNKPLTELRDALDEPAPVSVPAAAQATSATPCPACARADQAGLAPAELHPACRAVADDPAVMPADAPAPDYMYPQEECPHCDERPYANRMDEHLATAHADIPPCTATLDHEYTDGPLSCVLRAKHRSWYAPGYYWHASAHGPVGRTVWNDTAIGATPHKEMTDG
jgi:hypothetical protein